MGDYQPYDSRLGFDACKQKEGECEFENSRKGNYILVITRLTYRFGQIGQLHSPHRCLYSSFQVEQNRAGSVVYKHEVSKMLLSVAGFYRRDPFISRSWQQILSFTRFKGMELPERIYF